MGGTTHTHEFTYVEGMDSWLSTRDNGATWERSTLDLDRSQIHAQRSKSVYAANQSPVKKEIQFQRFLHLDVSSEVPNKNTVWLFKERLGDKGIQELFCLFEHHLLDHGLTASPRKIVDATIVETKRVHAKKKPEDELKRGPRWTKKRNQAYFGFKNHIKVNAQSKLIETYEATPANIHDGSKVESLADETRDRSIHADSSYCGREEAFRERGIEAHFNRAGISEPFVKRCRPEG